MSSKKLVTGIEVIDNKDLLELEDVGAKTIRFP